ncbi:HlyD family secretion protein [Pseudomonas matsuisoli]|uniref:Hemolysin D n=1 Tax=Pseudomonas matsuisoli TaxID=1515666 RepID=A0A917UT98_9PSED|nr:HlyD family secretion protein [Pseudomonas matsuisoli]GGJ83770.1 hemolysin D [Pseudomonas matsuisoli]
MKIRFDSNKERKPTQDNGLEVLYAPGKRTAFRLRWYLILFLIVLPALVLTTNYGLDLIRVEAPALIRLPMTEVRARQPGQISKIDVRQGDHVDAGLPLLQMDNPEWRLRLAVLQLTKSEATSAGTTVNTRNRAVLRTLVERARARVTETRRLLRSGAATRGELLNAENERDAREAELLSFERSVIATAQNPADDRYRDQLDAERKWLIGQLKNLQQRAPENGRIAEIIANEGENVGPGTLLMRMERSGPAQLWIYMNPSDVEFSTQGTRLRVRLPDGNFRAATVLNPAETTNPLPPDLRRPFSSPTRGLLVLAEFDEPLPNEWRVDSLPVQVRFPGRTLSLFGLNL